MTGIAQIAALFISLILIVFLVQRKLPLYQVMGIGILILLISLGRPPAQMVDLLWHSLIDRITLELVAATGLLSLLGRLLKELKFLDNLTAAMVNIFCSIKVIIMLIPALIGLFHVLGGAVLSAPVVDNLGERLKLSPVKRTSINLVFRHVVVYLSPFNPHLILLSAIAGVEILQLLILLMPIGVVNAMSGYFIYLHKINDQSSYESCPNSHKHEHNYKYGARDLLYYGAPLFVSLVLFAVLRVHLLIAISVGIFLALLLGEKKDVNWKDIFTYGPNPRLMLGIAGIMVFRFIVNELDQLLLAMETISNSGIPTYLLFMAVPLVIGFISASFSITVGITAPVLLSLLKPEDPILAYAVLLFASGYFSYFISPIHVCQVVSNTYFAVNTLEAHRSQYTVLGLTYMTGLIVFMLGLWFL